MAIGAGTIAVLEAGALILLTPLKTVEPYTLLVDRTTGYVQALKPLDADKIAPDTALTQSFLVQYVIARESFDIDTVTAELQQGRLLVGRAGPVRLSERGPGLQSPEPADRLSRGPP